MARKDEGLALRVNGLERGLRKLSDVMAQGLQEMRAALETFREVREREESLLESIARLGDLVRLVDDKLETVIRAENRIEMLARVIELQGARLKTIEKKAAG